MIDPEACLDRCQSALRRARRLSVLPFFKNPIKALLRDFVDEEGGPVKKAVFVSWNGASYELLVDDRSRHKTRPRVEVGDLTLVYTPDGLAAEETLSIDFRSDLSGGGFVIRGQA